MDEFTLKPVLTVHLQVCRLTVAWAKPSNCVDHNVDVPSPLSPEDLSLLPKII